MNDSSDFPRRHATHTTNALAELRFEAAVQEAGSLLARKETGRDDYGTDFQLEVVMKDGEMTNFRVHVQLKGTDLPFNSDGSISISVKRSTLLYLLSQPDSLFVCCHLSENRLLVAYAQEVFQQYERHVDNWQSQREITVRFRSPFDASFQRELALRVLARGKQGKSERDGWEAASPENNPHALRNAVPSIEVPHDKEKAKAILSKLFDACDDDVISKSFEKFAAVLDESVGEMDLAYMAEINLGVTCRRTFSSQRVLKAVKILRAALERPASHPGAIHYCIGNAWLAVENYSKALESYSSAISFFEMHPSRETKAFCLKNMGATYERIGDFQAARAAYEEALLLNPELPEAHMAMGHWHRVHSRDYEAAIAHFESAMPENDIFNHSLAPLAWKAECLFLADRGAEAFIEIRGLQRMASHAEWVQPWCSRLVAMHGRRSVEGATAAKKFWKWFLKRSSANLAAKRELFMCYSYLDAAGQDEDISYATFKMMAEQLIAAGDSEAGLLWDRAGHWAMRRKDWNEAEFCFRKASDLDPKTFGSCLGVALNNLGRFEKALPILKFQAEEHWQDALSWGHLAISLEGVGDIDKCIAAYRKALELDPVYALAWFNLGGIYWNAKMFEECACVWSHATKNFPGDPRCEQARMLLVLAEHNLNRDAT